MATSQTHPSFGDRLLWTVILGAFTGAAGMVAARMAESTWRRVRHTPPPKTVGFMSKYARRLSVGAIATLTHP